MRPISLTHKVYNFIKIIDLYIDKTELYKNILEITLVVFGTVLLIIGIFGCAGAIRKSKCCLCIFEIGAIVFAALFLGAGFFTTEISAKVFIESILT